MQWYCVFRCQNIKSQPNWKSKSVFTSCKHLHTRFWNQSKSNLWYRFSKSLLCNIHIFLSCCCWWCWCCCWWWFFFSSSCANVHFPFMCINFVLLCYRYVNNWIKKQMFTENKAENEENEETNFVCMKRARAYCNNLIILPMQCIAHSIAWKFEEKWRRWRFTNIFNVLFTQSTRTITWKTIEQSE